MVISLYNNMNEVERKRLALLSKRLKSVESNKRLDLLHKKFHDHDDHLEISSVATERIKNTTRSGSGSGIAKKSEDQRNRPRAVSIRANRKIQKQENDIKPCLHELSEAKANAPSTSIPSSSASIASEASFWSKDKIDKVSVSLVEKELSKRAASRYRPAPTKGRSQVLPSVCEKSVSALSLDAATYNRRQMRPRAISRRCVRSSQTSGYVDLNNFSSGSVRDLKQSSSSEIMSSSRSLHSSDCSRNNPLEKKNLPEHHSSDSSISNLVSTLRSLLQEVQDTNKSSESYNVCCTILEQLEKSHSAEVSSLSHQIEKWQKLYVEELVSNNVSAVKTPSISKQTQQSSEKYHKPPKEKPNNTVAQQA